MLPKIFFPGLHQMWNLLNNETVNSTSINVFKSNLLSLPHYAHIKRSLEAVLYNSVLNGHNGKIVTQFRLGLSPLRSELFTYNIIENPFCPMCGDEIENLKHFLFDCVKYCEPRENMAVKITALFKFINQLYIPALDHLDPTSQPVVTHILLHGLNLSSIDCDINKNINLEIFAIFSSYISQTARFVKIL